jgi:hypothetical protein
MRCIHKTCPMGGRYCPAVYTCPEVKRTVAIKPPARAADFRGGDWYLSPAEAVEMMRKLQKLTAHIPDLGNPPDFWPEDE